jgi:membrane fusion protein, multidrug efflux system
MNFMKLTTLNLTLFCVLIVDALLLCGCEPAGIPAKPAAAEESPVEVNTVHPHRGEIYRYINLPGEVHPLFQVTLFAKVDGYLDNLTVDKGDSVKAGDLIADIDVPELRANKLKYAADVELAEAEFNQVSEASTNNPASTSPSEKQEAQNRIAVAKGRLAVAKGNLEYTEAMLKYARVTAPFDGIITKRFVDPGAYIPVPNAADTPEAAAIVTVTDFKTLRMQVAVPETEAPYIQIGQPIRWTTDDYPGQNFDGAVTRAYWALDKATKTMLTEVQMTNTGMELRPGMLVNARIAIEKKEDALLIPVAALIKEKANSFAFILDSGKAKKTPIQSGFNDGTNVEVLAGINIGDLAILAGPQTLRDGQSVKMTNDEGSKK